MNGAQFTPDDLWLKTNFRDLEDFALIGQGGQKLVLSARHPDDGLVVLKIFHPNQTIAEVEREILAVRRVQSPHVPHILAYGDVGTPIGRCFWFREERVEGKTLRDRLAQGPLAAREVLPLGKEILSALAIAENESIVHRDVKPDNIIVDPTGKFWLLDFGLARHLTLDSLTATGLPWGKMTPGYAPPEQVRNDKQNIDARADLFALGVTLYESATGINPFHDGARDLHQVVQRCETMPLPPLTLPIQESDSFRDLISALTQKRRDHRPSAVSDAAAWMQEVCDANGI